MDLSANNTNKSDENTAQPIVSLTLPGWRTVTTGTGQCWWRGPLIAMSPETIVLQLLNALDKRTDPTDALKHLDGHFAVVVQHRNGAILAAVDSCRTIPLLIAQDQTGRTVIGQCLDDLRPHLSSDTWEINHNAALGIALAGYTIRRRTLFTEPRITSLMPGEAALLHLHEPDPQILHHHRYEPWAPDPKLVGKRAIDAAVAATEAILDRAVDWLNGRPVMVPLSAGNDSRLMASGLQARGHKDIRCYTFGRAGNHEETAAKAITERLGLPWQFIPYTNRIVGEIQNSADFETHRRRADSGMNVLYQLDYAAITLLQRQGAVPPDAVFVNGNSGDFITGNHIPVDLVPESADSGPDSVRPRILAALVRKHFKHWRSLETNRHLEEIRRQLGEYIDSLPIEALLPANVHGAFEWCEFNDRQSKFVIAGQRAYEHLGYDWLLPLWDRVYLDFWAQVPRDGKLGQSLFRETLQTLNYGDVWSDIPINRKTIRPAWVRPIRMALKTAYAPFGRARWHRFEHRFLQHLMATLCLSGGLPFSKVVLYPHSPLTSASIWHDLYLKEHGTSVGAIRDEFGAGDF